MSLSPSALSGGWRDERPDPLWARSGPERSAHHRILGLEVAVSANAEWLLTLAAEAFGPSLPHVGATIGATKRSGEADRADDQAGADLHFRLIAGPPPGGDGWPVSPADATDGRPVLREDGDHFCAYDGAGGLVMADLVHGAATAWVPERTSPDRARRVLLESPVWRLATRRGLLAIHAAAIVVDGVAVLVRGGSGAGKSSVALAADGAGLAVLSEEVAWVDPGRWAVWPSARFVHLVAGDPDDPAVGGAVGIGGKADHVRGVRRSDGETGKRAVRLLVPAPEGSVALGPLVLLDPPARSRPGRVARAAAPTRWSSLEPRAARARFEAERIVGEHAQPADRWDAAADRLCAAGAVVLGGGDPAGRVAMLAPIAAAWRAARSALPGGPPHAASTDGAASPAARA